MELTDPKLKPARDRGWLDGFEHNRMWRETFVGAFVSKFPKRIRFIEILQIILDGKVPEWTDLTDAVFRELKRFCIDNNVFCKTTLHVMFGELKTVLHALGGEYGMPSKNYPTILSVKSEPCQAIYYTEEELNKMYKYKPRNAAEKYVKNLTLIQCYTGMRHSDVLRIDKSNMSEGILTYVTKKTRTKVELPIHVNLPHLLSTVPNIEICDKYFNEVLREICQKIGMKERVKIFRRGREEEGEKWTFASSHTARRTFASLLNLHDVDIYTISKLAGHSNIEMTQRYIVSRRSFSQNALDFFNNKKA